MLLLSYLFQYDNIKVLNNILGIIYIDQDKGWSLLNRGTVVGKIKFSIEELLSGLNGVSIDELIEEKRNLEYTKKKYEALLNIQELSEQVYEKNGEIFITDVEKEYSERIAFLNLKLSDLKRSLKEINEIINKEKNFFAYIDAMNLSVKSGDIEIPVNRDTLVNAPETMELFKARRSIIVTDIEKINREKAKYELVLKERDLKKFQTSLYDSDDTDVIINKKLAELSFSDQDVVSNLLEKTKSDLKGINNRIKEAVKKDNKYISKIYNYVYEYAKRLEIEEKMVLKEDFIFTSDLKSLSGAVLQKMVFAFKIAFLKVIEDDIGTNLFFVMDSPKNKELDDYNTELIMNLIKDELNSNQVFIASIYEFDNENKIEIKTKAIDRRYWCLISKASKNYSCWLSSFVSLSLSISE